jgi:hypothetical protein
MIIAVKQKWRTTQRLAEDSPMPFLPMQPPRNRQPVMRGFLTDDEVRPMKNF